MNDDKRMGTPRMDGPIDPSNGPARKRHFHDALHPGGVQGVRSDMDTEGSLGSQSGPQPSGGRTGSAEHLGPLDDDFQGDEVPEELGGEEIGDLGKPATAGSPATSKPAAPKDFHR